MRLRLAALALVLAPLLLVLPAATSAQTLALRPNPVAHSGVITLSDMFEGVPGPSAATVVARAAPPGMDAVLDADAVRMAARRAGFDWPNPTGFRRIIVTSLSGGLGTPAGRAGAGASATAPRERARAVLAYARNIAFGEILTPADLVWSDAAVAPADALADADAAVGQAARRPLRAGAAASASDLTPPTLVKRDDMVVVAYEADGVSLALQGKAKANAVYGQAVEVVNLQSSKTIEAVCVGPDRAVVGPRAEAVKAAVLQSGGQGRLETASLH